MCTTCVLRSPPLILRSIVLKLRPLADSNQYNKMRYAVITVMFDMTKLAPYNQGRSKASLLLTGPLPTCIVCRLKFNGTVGSPQ